MQLVDAIEAWGRAHRSSFDRDEADALAGVWRTIRASEHASLDVATMTKDQARSVMSVFDAEQRSSVASTLNKVRKWTISQQAEAEDESAEPEPESEPEPEVEPEPDPEGAEPDEPGPMMRTSSTSSTGTTGAPELRETVTIDGSMTAPSARETLPASGPVEGWEPPSPVDDPPGAIDQRIILGLIGLVLAVLLIWFLFLRSDDGDATDPVNTGPDTIEDVIDRTNQAFLDQFELSPEVGQCLIDEFGDLASAATDATRREREVCGTSLLELITDAS